MSGRFMSAWLTRLLFVLALTIQVIAPVAGHVASAREGGSVACLTVVDDAAGRPQPAHHHDHGKHDCALCQTFCDGVAPVAAPPVTVGLAPLRWDRLRWTAVAPVPPAAAGDEARRARAPPAFS
jgi:hypothetical protein